MVGAGDPTIAAPRHRALEALLWLGPAVALGVAAALALLARRQLGPMPAAALWGILVLLGFAGWGTLVMRLLAPEATADLALRMAWGLSASVVMGGLLCLLRLARLGVLVAWVLAGLALLLGDIHRRRGGAPTRITQAWRRLTQEGELWTLPIVAGLGLMAALHYLGAAARGNPNPADDWIAYIPFARMIQQAGTLIDPFNFRRMTAYGGQSLLQALTMIVAEPMQIHLFDQGLCGLLVLGLVWGFASRARQASRLVLLALALMLLQISDLRANSASAVSGVAIFVALYRTAAWLGEQGRRGPRAWAMLALVAATACSLRANYVPVVALFVLAFFLFGAGGEEQGLAARARALAAASLMVLLFVLPWAILSFQSNHSLLFPLFRGNYDPSFAPMTSKTLLLARFKQYVSNAFHGDPVHTIPLFVVAGLGLPERSPGRPLAALWLATALGFVLLVWSVPEGGEWTMSRYNYPYTLGYVVVACLVAAQALGQLDVRRLSSELAAPALVVMAMAIQVNDMRGTGAKRLTDELDHIATALKEKGPLEERPPAYARLQESIPRGDRLLVMVERPYQLDYRRNRIQHLDLPGAASPPPGLPISEGAEAVASYLTGRGIRYFAFTDPDKAEGEIYSRAHWKHEKVSGLPVWQRTAPPFLAMFDDVTDLARTRKHLYDDGHLILVDLKTSR